jgi:Ca2+/H+ antiporter
LLPFAIGIAGLLVLVFAMLVMYRLAANEEAAGAPVPVDENAAQQQEHSADPAPTSSSSEPITPEKRPPLDEH